jgi:hypothetical protein
VSRTIDRLGERHYVVTVRLVVDAARLAFGRFDAAAMFSANIDAIQYVAFAANLFARAFRQPVMRVASWPVKFSIAATAFYRRFA